MRFSLLLFASAVLAGAIYPRQATAPFDCGEVRVDSPNATYSGFLAANLDTERRYVVTRTATEKRLLTRFENNTLFTLVSCPLDPRSILNPHLNCPNTEQQRQESNLRRDIRLLLGYATGETELLHLGAELRLFQQRRRLEARRIARQHRRVD